MEEHLRFYASLKTGEEVGTRKEIDKMIEDLGLSHKKYELSLHLSGGMKRKLSIGAAFIGNSKCVYQYSKSTCISFLYIAKKKLLHNLGR